MAISFEQTLRDTLDGFDALVEENTDVMKCNCNKCIYCTIKSVVNNLIGDINIGKYDKDIKGNANLENIVCDFKNRRHNVEPILCTLFQSIDIRNQLFLLRINIAKHKNKDLMSALFEELTEHFNFRPGGQGYLLAESEFNSYLK